MIVASVKPYIVSTLIKVRIYVFMQLKLSENAIKINV